MSEQIESYVTPRNMGFSDWLNRQLDVAESRRPENQPMRQALVRLRLAEFVAADHLPPDLMQELTAAIDGVIAIVGGRP